MVHRSKRRNPALLRSIFLGYALSRSMLGLGFSDTISLPEIKKVLASPGPGEQRCFIVASSRLGTFLNTMCEAYDELAPVLKNAFFDELMRFVAAQPPPPLAEPCRNIDWHMRLAEAALYHPDLCAALPHTSGVVTTPLLAYIESACAH